MVTLKPGDKAPAFSGVDQDGKKISLKDFQGKKLVLYFYPEDDTPTCTIQACNLRDNYTLLKKNGFEILGVSPDKPEKHKKFEKKFDLPFTLLADPDHTVLEKYGVWEQKKLFGHEYMGVLRTTFVLDEKGVIQHVFTRPKNKAHAEEIIAAYKSTGAKK
jgi:peroxiredoxin Q/BCP